MTQEKKSLLLQDLCARLPYGVKLAITKEKTETLKSIGITQYDLIPINLFYKKPLFYLINEFGNIEYKPYLRPMSSMTEEEKKIYQSKQTIIFDFKNNKLYVDNYYSLDYLNSIHVDYRDLIHKGLALEAPKDMYK